MISIDKTKFIKVLDRCSKVAPQKSTSAQLSHVKIVHDDVLQYSVTNLVTSIVGAIDASGKAESFTVNVHELLARCQSVIGDKVKLSVKGSKLTVSGEGKRSFTVSTLPADEFPAIALDATEWVNLPGKQMRNCISRVLFATASDKDDRPGLKSVRLRALDGILSAAAANGYCLAESTDAIESQDSLLAIIPKAATASILAADDEIVAVSVSEESISFRSGSETLIARGIDANFPPVDKALADNKSLKSAQIQAPSVLDSLAAIRRTDSKSAVDLTFADGSLKIECVATGDDAYAVDQVEAIGKDSGTVTLSADYLTSALKSCANATISWGDTLDPITIKDGMYTAIIMPILK